MKEIKYKVFRLFPPFCFLAIALFWLMAYGGHIYFWGESGFFQSTFDYFREQFFSPGGASEYLGSFLSLFFRWKIVGALLLTLPLCMVYYSMHIILRHLQVSVWRFAWAWIPVILLFFLQFDQNMILAESLKISVLFLFAALYMVVQRAARRYFLFFILFPVIALLVSPGGCFLLWGVMAVYECCRKNRNRVLFLSLWLFLSIVAPLIRQQYLMLIADDHLYSFYLPVLDNGKYLLVILLAWLPLVVAASRFSYFRASATSGISATVSVLVPIVLLVGFSPYRSHRSAELLMRADEAVQYAEWDKVVEISKREETPSKEMIYLGALALSQKDRLPQELFNYPLIGLSNISPTRDYDYFRNLYAGEFYLNLGVYNEAIHRFFQSSADSPRIIDIRTLKRLISLNIKSGFFRRAEKYISILSEIPLYGKEVRQFDADVAQAREGSISFEPNDFLIGGWTLTVELAKFLDLKRDNIMAQDYLLCGLLLEKDLSRFIKILSLLYPSDKSRQLPKAYEEAVVWLMNQGDAPLPQTDYSISENTKQRFRSFLAILRNNLIPAEGKEQAASKFKDTVWYYLSFRGASAQLDHNRQLNIYD